MPSRVSLLLSSLALVVGVAEGCRPAARSAPASARDASPVGAARGAEVTAGLPLVLVRDVDLPGGPTRFDYQDVDRERQHLVITHMNDASVLVLDLRDGSLLKELHGIPLARGVVVASDIRTIFVASSPNTLVLVDGVTFEETARVTTGNGPDGVAWDPKDQVVGVSDQRDGALSLIAGGGRGLRKQVKLGAETGNAIFDAGRGWFWVAVVATSPPDRLVAIDPVTGTLRATIPLPGCDGAHGLRLHPDGESAFVACEGNAVLVRVGLGATHAITIGATGADPDVLAIDPGLGFLYVAAESGDLTVFDVRSPGVKLVGHDHPGKGSHSVAVDVANHRVFFPLKTGPNGTPVLRILRPSGT